MVRDEHASSCRSRWHCDGIWLIGIASWWTIPERCYPAIHDPTIPDGVISPSRLPVLRIDHDLRNTNVNEILVMF